MFQRSDIPISPHTYIPLTYIDEKGKIISHCVLGNSKLMGLMKRKFIHDIKKAGTPSILNSFYLAEQASSDDLFARFLYHSFSVYISTEASPIISKNVVDPISRSSHEVPSQSSRVSAQG